MMVSVVSNKIIPTARQQWWHAIKRDLSPYAGRWEQAWRIALLCALMTLVSMTYGIPAAVLSCYVLFFVMKSDAAETMVMAVALVVLVSVVVFILIGLINLTIVSPPLRLLALVLVSVIFLYLGNASVLGPLGGIIALVIAFVLTLLEYIPVGELATRAVLYAWLMTAAPMGLLFIFSLFLGRKPKDVLESEIKARLELAALGLEHKAPVESLQQDLALGLEAQQKRLNWLKLFHLTPKSTQQQLNVAVVESYKRLLQAFLLLQKKPTAKHPKLAAECRALAEDIYDFDAEKAAAFVMPTEKTSFFVDDAFTNPTYQRTAVKATGAAVLCYLFYSAAQWEGIHTAMITCYVATLGTTGETVNKLFLRITGALIGAGLGLLLIFFFIPHMTSIGSLMIVVFLVSLLAAWVYLGTERVSYAGLQIAFAFLLISLDGFGPAIDVDTASNRIIGILVGNTMMYLAFTQIWPQSIMQSVKKKVIAIEKKLQQLQKIQSASDADAMAAVVHTAAIAAELEEANYEFSLVLLEPRRLRPDSATLQEFQQRLAALEARFEQRALDLIAPS